MPYRSTSTKTLIPSAARTSDGQGSGFLVEEYIECKLYLNITAASGTVVITPHYSHDDSTYHAGSSSPAYSTTGAKTPIDLTVLGKYMRIDYTITGTSVTFDVVGVFKT
jgi:hypothetical protein